MKKVIFFTNIVAPYRITLFNELERLRQGSNFDFEVVFMQKTEQGRDWDVDLNTIKFKHKIGNGLCLKYKDYFLYFNPILLYQLIRSKEEIILGGSWNNLNVFLLAILKKLKLIKNKLSVWSEANYLTNQSRKKNNIRDTLRKFFFSQIDGNFIVPGKISVISFEKWNIPIKNVIFLPNLVSDKLFNKQIDVDKPKHLQFLIVARLEEHLKGIKNFMQAIGVDNLRKITLHIAGEGYSRKDYQAFIDENELNNNIILLGNLSQDEISKEYKNALGFILPSFSDSSPLAIVEAIKSGLPVLVSNRCGNHYEAVNEGENGFTFNPDDHLDIKDKYGKFILACQSNYNQFAENSVRIADENFNLNHILSRFIEMYK